MTKLTKLRATIESRPVKNTTIITITLINHDQYDDHRHYYDQYQPEERRMVESGQRRPCNRKSLSRGWFSYNVFQDFKMPLHLKHAESFPKILSEYCLTDYLSGLFGLTVVIHLSKISSDIQSDLSKGSDTLWKRLLTNTESLMVSRLD